MEVIWRFLRGRHRVYKLRISGPVTVSTVSAVAVALARRRITQPVALAIVLNAQGGSLVQGNILKLMIEAYGRQRGIPVLSFIEDCATGPGYIVATAGKTIYAHPSSMVGGVGTQYTHFNLNSLFSKLKIKRKVWVSSQTVFERSLNFFRKLQKSDQQHFKQMLSLADGNVNKCVFESRGDKIKSGSVLEDAATVSGCDAVNLGYMICRLVDKIGQFENALIQDLQDVGVLDITKESGVLKRLKEAVAIVGRFL